MKKALIVLLLLAVAGGLFAQGWTFNGNAEGGLGVFIFEGVDDPYVQQVDRDNGLAGSRVQFLGEYTNEAKNAGLKFRIRGDQGGAAFNYGYGWVSALDNMLWLAGGKIDNFGTFVALDKMFGDDSGEGTGLLAVIAPVDGFQLSFGGYGPAGAVDTNDKDAPANMLLENAKGVIQAAFEMPDTFKVTAGFRNDNRVGGKIFNQSATFDVGGISQAYISFAYLGMADLHAAVSARFLGLDEFSDYGAMFFYETFAYTGVENLSLNLGISEGISQDDNADLNLWVWFWLDYKLMEGKIVPRLDVNYVMGGKWNNFQNLQFKDRIRDGVSFVEEDSFLNIRPSIGFRASDTCWLELGYMLQADLGDNSTISSAVVPNPTSDNKGVNHAIYADVKVSF